jgi:hypothetical protein
VGQAGLVNFFILDKVRGVFRREGLHFGSKQRELMNSLYLVCRTGSKKGVKKDTACFILFIVCVVQYIDTSRQKFWKKKGTPQLLKSQGFSKTAHHFCCSTNTTVVKATATEHRGKRFCLCQECKDC